MSDLDPIDVISDLYLQSCTEFFLAYGASGIHRRDADAPHHSATRYVSAISATGQGISLLSTVSVDAEALDSTHPSSSGTATPAELEDWCRELNNQLAGRLKNKLIPLGCDLRAGLPALVTGMDISVVSPADAETRQFYFAARQGGFAFMLATLLSPHFTLASSASAASSADVMPEGAVSLF